MGPNLEAERVHAFLLAAARAVNAPKFNLAGSFLPYLLDVG